VTLTKREGGVHERVRRDPRDLARLLTSPVTA
jgi:hypothetical protein